MRGRLTLWKYTVVGARARLLGLLALSVAPLELGAVLLYLESQDPERLAQFEQATARTIFAIETGVVIGVAILVFVLTAVASVPEANRGEDDNAEEEDEPGRDDRPRSR